MVLSAFNPRTQEAEAGGSLWVQGQPGLQSSLEDNQWCYTERFCLEKPKKKVRFDWSNEILLHPSSQIGICATKLEKIAEARMCPFWSLKAQLTICLFNAWTISGKGRERTNPLL